MSKKILYEAIPVETGEFPPMAQIVVVLLDGRLPMMSQVRPSENGRPEWWTLGMSNASRIEEKKKCVTHWLKPIENDEWLDESPSPVNTSVGYDKKHLETAFNAGREWPLSGDSLLWDDFDDWAKCNLHNLKATTLPASVEERAKEYAKDDRDDGGIHFKTSNIYSAAEAQRMKIAAYLAGASDSEGLLLSFVEWLGENYDFNEFTNKWGDFTEEDGEQRQEFIPYDLKELYIGFVSHPTPPKQ